MHARAVKGYPLRNKTDRNDTDAILEASRSEKVKPIPVKSALRQQIQQVHMMCTTGQLLSLIHISEPTRPY